MAKGNSILDDHPIGEIDGEKNYVEDLSFTDAEIEAMKTYNENIKNIIPMYDNLECLTNSILVRIYKDIPLEEDGVFVPNTKLLPVRTRSGHGTYDSILDPYSFSQKALVISELKNEFINLNKFDELIIKRPPLEVVGAGDEASINLVNSFVHPESGLLQMPLEPSSEHHGYFLITIGDLLFKNK